MRQNSNLRKLNKLLTKIHSWKDHVAALSDEELAAKTGEFKGRLAEGETLDELLPEAFAVVCEADWRILGKYPYDVQILGAIALHQGYLAEMNTGEGKTLTATMPLYLNALTGESTILVTTNEYLAQRDAKEMGEVYTFLGLTVEAGVQDKNQLPFTNADKKKLYDADILYTTHSVLGFDYLFNNLVNSAEERFMRPLYYVIIDEADAVLLDSAQTPLVISGSPRVQSNLYELADFFVTTLEENVDYEKEDKKVWLTEEGVARAERFFEIDNFYGEEFFEVNRHVTLALRAHVLFEKEKDYVVSDKGEIILLDGGSGRMMPGVKIRGGAHQALEVKEKLKLSMENRSVASITYQNLFLLFPKMSGMSGTISDAQEELLDVYGRNVIVIPPNHKVLRKDYKDIFFADELSQITEAISKTLNVHRRGQPVLVVVSTIRETEIISKLLLQEHVPHNVLNANNAYWEAEIIKEAGQRNAVTVSTSMAGRGTDIKLGEGVKELGGLAVIGIGRMINVRQERQARGRAGRQGDPGFSQFFVSLEDEVVKNNTSKKLEKYVSGEKKASQGRLKRWIDGAQKLSEELDVSKRNQAIQYDTVMKAQRQLMYQIRNDLLDGETVSKEKVFGVAKRNIHQFLEENPKYDGTILARYSLDNISYHVDEDFEKWNKMTQQEVEEALMQLVEKSYLEQVKHLEKQSRMDIFVNSAILNAIDDAWVEQVDYLQQLQSAVSGRASAQRNVIFEYQKDGLESFGKMEKTILRNVMRNILLSNVYVDAKYKMHIVFP